MVKRAADSRQALYTAEERVERAFAQVTDGMTFTTEQGQWLERIRAHLVENLSIDRDAFDLVPVLEQAGGWGRANTVFDGKLTELIEEFNEAIAA